ncbi:MAG: M48 family metallopeptidase [Saprospiraceae bacterium]|nr:M48 family metallopeptidase [Saprospiraceae bacterium]
MFGIIPFLRFVQDYKIGNKKILLWVVTGIYLFGPAISFGQLPGFDQYTPLSCQGEIPAIFTTSSTEKYQREIEAILQSGPVEQDFATLDQFTLETNFVIDDLLQSGLVLFNDEVSNYLNEVMQKLLWDEPELQKYVTVYTLRTESVNAFATNQGAIFVTLGLISMLENEAQLAYILSHELVHVKEKHALNLYLKTATLQKGGKDSDLIEETGISESLLSENHYSKEVETEADNLGLERLLKTNYSFATLNSVFDIFKYAYLPFAEVPFDRAVFEGNHYIFPENFFLEELNEITGEDEDADDSESSHPNIGTRRMAMQGAIKDLSNEGRQEFLVSEETFIRVRELARFEIPLLHLHAESFAEVIYCCHLLLQKYPNNFYLRKTLGKALYVHAKYANDDDYFFEGNYKLIEGELQQVHYFLKKLRNKEATILALRYNWETWQNHRDDPELTQIVEDLFIELCMQFDDLDEFIISAPVEMDTLAGDSLKTTSRKSDYWKLAFIDQIGTESFLHEFEKGLEESRNRAERRDYFYSSAGRTEWRKHLIKIKKKGLNLGLDKIVIVNPGYLKMDQRIPGGVKYLETELAQKTFANTLEELALLTPVEIELLDVCRLNKSQTDAFNEIRILNDWFSQQLQQDDLSLTAGYRQNELNEIADHYGTDYFLWTGVFTFQKRKKTVLYGMLFDIRTGRRVIVKFDFFNKRDRAFLVRGHTYDMLNQIGR